MNDYRRVIELILEELARAGAVAPSRCSCHGFTSECCPDRVQHVIDAGAAGLGLHASDGGATGVSGYIDHTLLKADATAKDRTTLRGRRLEVRNRVHQPGVGRAAAKQLRGTSVGVCAVWVFGATTPDGTVRDAARHFDNASEIDMVINVGR